MKKVNKFLAFLAVAGMFVGCGDDEPTKGEPEVQDNGISYAGTMVVVQQDETTYTQENVVVDYEITDTAGLVLTFNQVAFSSKMPIKIDMTLTNVQYEKNSETISFTGDGIVPIAMGGPFPKYTVTNLSGTVQEETMSLSMNCGGYPVTYTGTIQ